MTWCYKSRSNGATPQPNPSVWQRPIGKIQFAGDPVVELERGHQILRYRAHAVPGSHPNVDRLLREKYGLADRWVRLISPDNEDTVAVRLDPYEG